MADNDNGQKPSQQQLSPPRKISPDKSLISKASRKWENPRSMGGYAWMEQRKRSEEEYRYNYERFYKDRPKEKRKFPIKTFLFLLILFSVIGGLLSGLSGIFIGVGIVFFIALIQIIISLF